MQPEDEKIASKFIDFVNCEIDNRLNLKVGMWKTFVSISDGKQLIVPMCFTGAWDPSGSWAEMWLWTGGYKEKRERDVQIWLEDAHDADNGCHSGWGRVRRNRSWIFSFCNLAKPKARDKD